MVYIAMFYKTILDSDHLPWFTSFKACCNSVRKQGLCWIDALGVHVDKTHEYLTKTSLYALILNRSSYVKQYHYSLHYRFIYPCIIVKPYINEKSQLYPSVSP